jgi:hypothetical protein
MDYVQRLSGNWHAVGSKEPRRHPVSADKETVGRKWLKLFLRRQHDLSFRKPQRVCDVRIHSSSKRMLVSSFPF